MSSEKVEQKSHEQTSEPSQTIEREQRCIDVESKQYHVFMNENGESRFFTIIEHTSKLRRHKISVPMSISSDFCQKLCDVLKHCSTIQPQPVAVPKSEHDNSNYVYTVAYTSNAGRRYYFDVLNEGSLFDLRLSYLVGKRRDVVYILVDALPNLLEILEEFQKKWPSISATDDYPINPRRRFNDGRFSNNRGNQTYGSNPRPSYGKPFRSPRPPTQFNGKPAGSKVPYESKRTTPLKVLSDPMPTEVSSNLKKFTLELVRGLNTFMRITEFVNENRKSTIHIPIDLCSQLNGAIEDMNKNGEYPQTSPFIVS
ncbi:hypothetical protein HZS_4376, partial [Henneguya salminicola]